MARAVRTLRPLRVVIFCARESRGGREVVLHCEFKWECDVPVWSVHLDCCVSNVQCRQWLLPLERVVVGISWGGSQI